MNFVVRSLPVLMLLAGSVAASAQSVDQLPDVQLPAATADDKPAVPEAIPEHFQPLDQYAAPIAAPSPRPFIERSDVIAVRREITALRMACAAMPSHIETPDLPLCDTSSQPAHDLSATADRDTGVCCGKRTPVPPFSTQIKSAPLTPSRLA